ncbi:hypothetical protein HK102_012397 [Quaeritorhiza haematococci]|nr:hypothetical protein HK102_012397 [Quaeritorhiza haematococci]
MLAELRDPNLRRKLRKVKPKEPKADDTSSSKAPELTPEAKARAAAAAAKAAKEKEEEERQHLLIEMLGYMEAPNGSLDELIDKLVKSTSISRGFIFTLVRRGWCYGVRVVSKEAAEEAAREAGGDAEDEDEGRGRRKTRARPNKKKKTQACVVFPGREWTSAIELRDITEEQLEETYPPNETPLVCRVHMYRFDTVIKQHQLDEIALFQSPSFPPPNVPFTEPEPPQDSSLENRKKWEEWNVRKLAHQQSDSSQYDLVYKKLTATDNVLVNTYSQLTDTIAAMREMSDAVTMAFREVPVEKLRTLVESIPSRIKDVARRVHQMTGIIIRDDAVKLTPTFLKGLGVAATRGTENGEDEEDSGMAALMGSGMAGFSFGSGVSGEKKKKRRSGKTAAAAAGGESAPAAAAPAAEQDKPAADEEKKTDSLKVPSDAKTTSKKSSSGSSVAAAAGEESPENRKSLVTLGGIPLEQLLPLLKTMYNKNEVGKMDQDNFRKRFTMY